MPSTGWSGSTPRRCCRRRPSAPPTPFCVAPTPTIAPVMVWVVDTGMPRPVARNSVIAPDSLGAEAADRLELGDALPHRLHDAPAAEQRAQADRRRSRRRPPRSAPGRRSPVYAGGDQQHPDDADGLLRVVAAVAEAVERRRRRAAAGGTSGRRGSASMRTKIHETASISSEPSRKPSSGEMTMNATVFRKPAGIERPGARLGHRRADQAADQRVRGRRRDAVVPGDDVPDDRADQRAEHHVVVDDALVDDALADRGRDVQVEDEHGDEVEERRPARPPGRA